MRVDTRSKVVKSPFVDLINECLQSHWSAASIYRHLCLTYGAGYPHQYGDDEMWVEFGIPSYKSIQRYRDAWMPTAVVLPESLIASRVKNLDVNVDTLQALARLLPTLEGRIEKALKLEETMNGMVLTATDEAVRTYSDVLGDYIKHKFDLGLLRRPPTLIRSAEANGAEGAGGEEGEDDFDLLPDEVLNRILRGESRYSVTEIRQGRRVRSPANATRRPRARTGGESEGEAGESAPASD